MFAWIWYRKQLHCNKADIYFPTDFSNWNFVCCQRVDSPQSPFTVTPQHSRKITSSGSSGGWGCGAARPTCLQDWSCHPKGTTLTSCPSNLPFVLISATTWSTHLVHREGAAGSCLKEEAGLSQHTQLAHDARHGKQPSCVAGEGCSSSAAVLHQLAKLRPKGFVATLFMAISLTPKLTLRHRAPANHSTLIYPNSGLSLQHQPHYLLENTPTTTMLYRCTGLNSSQPEEVNSSKHPAWGGKSSWIPPGMLHLTGVLSSWVRGVPAWTWGNFQVVQWCHGSISFFHGHRKGFSTDFAMEWFKIQPKSFLLVYKKVLMKCP